MIISVSRRTDIPAYFSHWFYNRMDEGFVLVRNPWNRHSVTKVNLAPDKVTCFVFWTKNPEPFIRHLDLIMNYPFYFQFTVTPYNQNIEVKVPPKHHIIRIFAELSEMISPERIIWRYDPVIFTETGMDVMFHVQAFRTLAEQLSPFTRKCIISFFNQYRWMTKTNTALGIRNIHPEEMFMLVREFSRISRECHMSIETCSEAMDFDEFGIEHGKCIDDRLISKLSGKRIDNIKDPNQRGACGCIRSVDIGAYSTCLHGCRYCYASRYPSTGKKMIEKHDPLSPFLIGNVEPQDRITERS